LIPQIQPWIDGEELEQLKRVIDSTFVTEHKLTEEFEEITKELTGSKHAISMFNGTVALYSCLKALEIGAGDEVIVPNITFIATANAVLMTGAKPVFCEIREDTFCLDVDKAEQLITEKTKAIMPVHLYGQAADMDAIIPFAQKHNLFIVEDAAQGVGVKFNGKHTGTFGELGILSYYGNKTITTGEGGIVLTNDDELAKRCYRLKNHGRDKKGVFVHEHLGFNFSFTEMQAAIGIAQMKKLPKIIARKNQIYEKYKNELVGINGFNPVYIDPRCQPVFWFTSYLSNDVEGLAGFLLDAEIQTRRFFLPLNQQPCYNGVLDIKGDFSTSKRIYESGISLPSSYLLKDEEQDLVISKIKEYYSK